jgi:hypothetical protein
MKRTRTYSITSLVAVAATLVMSGAVMAADTATIGDTGPKSENITTINDFTAAETTNNNHIVVENANIQDASTGSADVSGNTNAGQATTGNATNNANTTTVVAINNVSGVGVIIPGSGGSSIGGSTGGTSATPGISNPVTSTTTGKGGSGVATLPQTGPADAINVDALRNLYQPTTDQVPTTNTAFAKQTRNTSALLLAGAALLSLFGAAGSAVYAKRRGIKA